MTVYHANKSVRQQYSQGSNKGLPHWSATSRLLSSHVVTISYFGGEDIDASSEFMPGKVFPIHHELQGYAWKNYKPEEFRREFDELERLGVNGGIYYDSLVERENKLKSYYPKSGQWMGNNQWFDNYLQKAFPGPEGLAKRMQVMSNRVRPPTLSVTVPTLSDTDVYVGLNDVAMINWWHDFTQKNKLYHNFKQNCATTCAGALYDGGGSVYASKPKMPIWTPTKVHKWGVKINESLAKYEHAFRSARKLLTTQSISPMVLGSVWDVNTWKKESDAGRFSRRYELLKKIDEALELYHKQTTNQLSKPAQRNCKLQNLVGIVTMLGNILLQRPKTKRRQAILILGQQALKQIDIIKSEHKGVRLDREFREIVSKYQVRQTFKTFQEVQRVLQSALNHNPEDPGDIEKDLDRLLQITNQLNYVPQL